MKRISLLAKLTFVLALLAITFGTLPSQVQATPGPCALACTNPPNNASCSSISCVCDAAGGQIRTCTTCSDTDYSCPGQEIYCNSFGDCWDF